MTNPKKELTVACSYLLRLIKAQVTLSPEQINVFKRTFYDVLSKRFVGHWFPGKYTLKLLNNLTLSSDSYFSNTASWKCLSMFTNKTLERSCS